MQKLVQRKTVAQLFGKFGSGGASRVAEYLAVGLESSSIRSILLAARENGTDDLHSFCANICRHDLGVKSTADILPALWRLRRYVASEQIDVLHVHGEDMLAFSALAIAGMRCKPRLVFTWHNAEWFGTNRIGLRQLPLLLALNACDPVFAASTRIADGLRALPVVRSRVEVFCNGVPEVEATTGMDEAVPVIVWAARFAPSKDPRALIKAAGMLHAEGHRFRIVMAGSAPDGLGEYYAESIDLARTLGIDHLVEFPGWLDSTDHLVRRAAIGVQTSHGEGLSMTLLEQAMAGLAVVATDVGDTSRLVQHGKTGLLVPAEDVVALCGALRRMLVEPGFRSRCGAAARELAMSRFSVQAMATQALSGYG